MKAFFALVSAFLMMLRRNRMLLIASVGLALISVFVFGWLFGSSGSTKLRLGVVDRDDSALASQMLTQLQQSDSLTVMIGSRDAELQALRDAHRDAVIVLQPGFGTNLRHGHATIQVYYDQSNPITQSNARMAVQSIVTNINQQVAGSISHVTLDEQAVSVHNLRQIDWLTPGMLGMMLMWANLSIGSVLVAWRQQGILRRLAATPVHPAMLMGTQMLARLILSLAQGAILIAVAMAVFKVQVIGSWWVLGLAVALGALTMMSLGFVAGSFARTPEAAQAVTFLVSFPMMFLGGSYFPTDSAPAFLAPIISVLPLSYLNDALRQIINNGASLQAVQTDLLVLAAWAVAALLLSVRAFKWI
jgi:ABC-2 type transport system permease protein